MNTTRTIIHSDGHTDVETYMKDADGVWIWAVTQCGLKQEKQAMQFLGTRVIGIDIDSQYIVADVVSDGAVLAHSVGVDEYITNLLKQIDALKAEVKNLDEGAKLLHSVAMNGEQSVLSRLDNGIDAVDAQRWQDAPEYKEAQQVSDKFNFDTVAEQEF